MKTRQSYPRSTIEVIADGGLPMRVAARISLIVALLLLAGCASLYPPQARYSPTGNANAGSHDPYAEGTKELAAKVQACGADNACKALALTQERMTYYAAMWRNVKTEQTNFFDLPLIATALAGAGVLAFGGSTDFLRGIGLTAGGFAAAKTYSSGEGKAGIYLVAQKAYGCVYMNGSGLLERYAIFTHSGASEAQPVLLKARDQAAAALQNDKLDPSVRAALGQVLVAASDALGLYAEASEQKPDTVAEEINRAATKIESQVLERYNGLSPNVDEIIAQIRQSASKYTQTEQKAKSAEEGSKQAAQMAAFATAQGSKGFVQGQSNGEPSPGEIIRTIEIFAPWVAKAGRDVIDARSKLDACSAGV